MWVPRTGFRAAVAVIAMLASPEMWAAIDQFTAPLHP